MRFVAAQFDAYLSDELWLPETPGHANAMAGASARRGLRHRRHSGITRAAQANVVFASAAGHTTSGRSRDEFAFYTWDERRRRGPLDVFVGHDRIRRRRVRRRYPPPAHAPLTGWSFRPNGDAAAVVGPRRCPSLKPLQVNGAIPPGITESRGRASSADPERGVTSMKALVFGGPGVAFLGHGRRPDQIIDATDAVVRVDASHDLRHRSAHPQGRRARGHRRRILGHEAVGTVTEIGSSVTSVQVGDRVLVSCISACGRCSYCRERTVRSVPGGGGWILGHLIDGAQAEYVRVPFADTPPTSCPIGHRRGRAAAGRHPAHLLRGRRLQRRRRPGTWWPSSGPARSAWLPSPPPGC